MREPSVCCVMITADRPEMAKRAVECFRGQTYDPVSRILLVLDTSHEGSLLVLGPADCENEVPDWRPQMRGQSIGELRNFANSWGRTGDILIHWDDDDISHPNRISEQVALLQSSGADAVGYNECLFWDSRMPPFSVAPGWNPNVEAWAAFEARARTAYGGYMERLEPIRERGGEAWLYSNSNPRYVLGTSLCYWRKAWEKRPFEALNDGEDTAWRMGVNCIGVSSLFERRTTYSVSQQPRMVCSIHAGNTSPWYRPELLRASEKQGGEWKRAEAWDDFCRERMTLGVKAGA